MSTLIIPKYKCTQAELYAIAHLAWNYARENQTPLASAFPEYTTVFIDARVADIQAAETLPDFQTRDSITEADHIILKQTAKGCIQLYNQLERYINRLFINNPELIKPNLEAAGKDYYPAATRSNPNWEDLRLMLLSAENYIAENIANLTPFIPVAFQADFTIARTDFEKKYSAFTLAESESPESTSTKIIANNAIHEQLMTLLGDLRLTVPEPVRQNITFAYFKGIVSSPGPAGFKGTILLESTTQPIPEALLRLLEISRETSTDLTGNFDFGNIPSGIYTLEIIKDGFNLLSTTIPIQTGVTSTKTYYLTPA